MSTSRSDLLKLVAASKSDLAPSGMPVRVLVQDSVTTKLQSAGFDDQTLQPITDIMIALVAAGAVIDVGYAATETCQCVAGLGLPAPQDDHIASDSYQDFWTGCFSDVHLSLTGSMMNERWQNVATIHRSGEPRCRGWRAETTIGYPVFRGRSYP